jgi:hypothetical protein
MPTPHALPIALTYEDYLGLPDDGKRHEILEGEHSITPAPSPNHQFVVGRLLYFFHLQVQPTAQGICGSRLLRLSAVILS